MVICKSVFDSLHLTLPECVTTHKYRPKTNINYCLRNKNFVGFKKCFEMELKQGAYNHSNSSAINFQISAADVWGVVKRGSCTCRAKRYVGTCMKGWYL